jgi:hypothetical protein
MMRLRQRVVTSRSIPVEPFSTLKDLLTHAMTWKIFAERMIVICMLTLLLEIGLDICFLILMARIVVARRSRPSVVLRRTFPLGCILMRTVARMDAHAAW